MGFSGKGAPKHGEQFVLTVRKALADLTVSLFPSHAISILPVRDVEATHQRIMAGYLLTLRSEDDGICVVYGELRSHLNGEATFALYTTHHCVSMIHELKMTPDVALVSFDSVDSNIFEVCNHRFCARTPSDQRLWLRSLINVKMKSMCGAPNPTDQHLAGGRSVVPEKMDFLKTPEPHSEELPR